MRLKRKNPEIVLWNGKPAAVILDIDEYQEMLERLEDVEDLKALQKMRKKPLQNGYIRSIGRQMRTCPDE